MSPSDTDFDTDFPIPFFSGLSVNRLPSAKRRAATVRSPSVVLRWIVAVIELGQIQGQMLLADLVKRSDDAAL